MSNQTNRTLKHSCNTEIKGKYIGNYNLLSVVHIPIGVTVYIGVDENLNIDSDFKLDEALEYKKDGDFTKPTKLYMHTMGTSAEELIIDCLVVNTQGAYFLNTKKKSLALSPVVEQLLFDNKVANETLLSNFDKVINPYEIPTIETINYQSTAISEVVNKTLLCDKISIYSGIGRDGSNTAYSPGLITIMLDGKFVDTSGCNTGASLANSTLLLENVRGKILSIKMAAAYTDYNLTAYATIQEYTLKA